MKYSYLNKIRRKEYINCPYCSRRMKERKYINHKEKYHKNIDELKNGLKNKGD